MPFCNQCGSPVESSAAQCPVCGKGASTPAGTAPPAASAKVPATPHDGRKVVPVFLVVVILLGIALLGAILLLYYHSGGRVRLANGKAEVETPFGKVAAGQDSIAVAHQLNFPVYPGAVRADDDSATQIDGMNGKVATMTFATPDPVAKVLAFYRNQFPEAVVKTEDTEHGELSIVDVNRVTTVNAQWDGAKTQIDVSIVQH